MCVPLRDKTIKRRACVCVCVCVCVPLRDKVTKTNHGSYVHAVDVTRDYLPSPAAAAAADADTDADAGPVD